MKRAILFLSFVVGFQAFVYSQNANPYISISVNTGRVAPGKTAIVEIVAGNAGVSPIQPNTMAITLTAGENAEIIKPLGAGSDPRWDIQTLEKGKGNTLTLVNSGKTGFNGFDLGKIYISVRGLSPSAKLQPINASIKYSNNSQQGNESSLDDVSMTSLGIGSSSSPATNTKPVVPKVRSQQDLDLSAKDCDVKIKWKVNDAQKPEKIEVEYSKNSIEFLSLGEATPKEGSSNEYEFNYYQGVGRGYYRLKSIFPGNVIEYSKLKEIVTNCVVKKGF